MRYSRNAPGRRSKCWLIRSRIVDFETFGTERVPVARIRELIDEHFDLRPGAFRKYLDLHRPIFQKTAAYGHFGREDHDFTWEKTDKAQALAAAAGLTMPEAVKVP